MLKRIVAGVSVLAVSAAVMTASAQDQPTPEQLATAATETRQGLLKVLGYNLGAISGMARGTVEFDAAIAERNARRIAMMAPMIPELFATDTRNFDVETEALPIIWEQMEEFREKAMNLENAANTFADIAAGGDRAQILGGLRAFGGTCGNCHETFRVDD